MRNTFDSKNPFSNNNPGQESKQRETYTNPNPKLMSFQKQAQSSNVSGPLNNQKMTKFILETLARLPNTFQNKVMSMHTLKPNQKTLFNTIGTLLHSFDLSFEEANLNIQMLPQLFRSLGYPNVINKTYFQPVGAPHTWSHCLAMMSWLAELAAFHIDIKSHLQVGFFQSDFTNLLMQSYLDQTPEIPKNYLQNQIKRKNNIIEDYRYTINTHNLSIQNLNSVQKDLNVLQEEQQRLELILSREKQQTIQVSQQNIEMERKLKDLQYKIEEQKKISKIKNDQITSLSYQIQNQELSVEQVQRIQFQIRQYHDKITQVKRFHENQKQNLDKGDANLINQYIDFSKTLENLQHLHRKYNNQMEKRNIYLQIPECDISKFTSFLKNRKDDCSDVKIQQIIQTKQIKQIKDKAEVLLNLVNLQLKKFDEQREQINQQNQLLNEESLEKDLKITELYIALDSVTTKLQSSRWQIKDTKMGNDHIKTQVSILENEMRKTEGQVEKNISQLEQLMSYTKELRQIKDQIQKNSIQSIQRMKSTFYNYQMQTLEMLDIDYEYFEKCAQNEEQNCENDVQNMHGNNQAQKQHQNIQLNQLQHSRLYPELKDQTFQLRELQQNKHQTQAQRN